MPMSYLSASATFASLLGVNDSRIGTGFSAFAFSFALDDSFISLRWIWENFAWFANIIPA